MEVLRAPDGRPGPAGWFTGDVVLGELLAPAGPSRLQVVDVRFAAGSRTAWHRHPFGQVVHVTAGEGRAQRRGGPVVTILPGDTVHFPPGEEHWHGAAPGSAMTHLAVQEAGPDHPTEWLDPVTDDEYAVPPADAGAPA
jgi:quercetin dioxygenase-like cupin family protein